MKTILFIIASAIASLSSLAGLVLVNSPEGNFLVQNTDLLRGSPFNNFFVPGILLIFLVGVPNLLVIYYLLQRNEKSYNWAMAGGVLCLLFLVVQITMGIAFHWAEILMLGAALMMILIAYQLKGKWAV